VEHDEQAARLEREVEELEQRSEEVGEDIEQTRREWHAKRDDSSVPGALPEADDE
jgi:hypothetical protein